MPVQIPERLKHALKQAALDRKTTVKALLIEMIEGHLNNSTRSRTHAHQYRLGA